MKVVLVGSGNVATVLGKVIHNAGHEIVQVLSRNENHAKELAKEMEQKFLAELQGAIGNNRINFIFAYYNEISETIGQRKPT